MLKWSSYSTLQNLCVAPLRDAPPTVGAINPLQTLRWCWYVFSSLKWGTPLVLLLTNSASILPEAFRCMHWWSNIPLHRRLPTKAPLDSSSFLKQTCPLSQPFSISWERGTVTLQSLSWGRAFLLALGCPSHPWVSFHTYHMELFWAQVTSGKVWVTCGDKLPEEKILCTFTFLNHWGQDAKALLRDFFRGFPWQTGKTALHKHTNGSPP